MLPKIASKMISLMLPNARDNLHNLRFIYKRISSKLDMKQKPMQKLLEKQTVQAIGTLSVKQKI